MTETTLDKFKKHCIGVSERRLRAFQKANGKYGIPRSMLSMRSGKYEQIIYAVSLVEHPDVTKVGMTTNWEARRKEYAFWNFANGDGIAQERLFRINEEFVDLPKLEKHILANIPLDPKFRHEWFNGDFDEVCREVDRIFSETGLCYVIE